MTQSFIKWNEWLEKNMFLLVLLGLSCGNFIILSDSSILRKTVIILFAYMTFVTSLTTSLKEFIVILRRPWIPLWILFLVHCIAPMIAWFAGAFFYPDDPYTRIGYLVGSAIPIGVTSIMWTALTYGDLAVSLVAVTLDTVLVPIILPLFFKLVVAETIHMDYFTLIQDLLLMVTIPSILGMLLQDWTQGRLTDFSKSIGGATSKIALFCVIVINSAMVMPQIEWSFSIFKTLLVTLFTVCSGYFTGYLGSFALKNRTRELTLTMIFNVGIRNNACGLVIALNYFPPSVAIPITLAILYQQPLATIIPSIYKKRSSAAEALDDSQQPHR